MILGMRRTSFKHIRMILSDHSEAATTIPGTKVEGGSALMTDTRGVGKPLSLKGDESKCGINQAQQQAFLLRNLGTDK
jgi:hypothetical protein